MRPGDRDARDDSTRHVPPGFDPPPPIRRSGADGGCPGGRGASRGGVTLRPAVAPCRTGQVLGISVGRCGSRGPPHPFAEPRVVFLARRAPRRYGPRCGAVHGPYAPGNVVDAARNGSGGMPRIATRAPTSAPTSTATATSTTGGETMDPAAVLLDELGRTREAAGLLHARPGAGPPRPRVALAARR
jgi:hypothetical protein